MSAFWVDETFLFGNVTITSYRNAAPSVETYGPEDDGHGGYPMDGADLIAAADKYRELLAEFNIHTQGS